MNPTAQVSSVENFRSIGRRRGFEFLLLGCSVLSLILSCLVWSAHKQAWMDEIFTWKEASDPSLWHLYWAIQHGADGGQPLFYTTVWFWRHLFGGGVLTLRLYSCAAMCGAVLILWRVLRRHFGIWSTAFGILMIWGTSSLMLDQNAEARFYGPYILVVAIAIALYIRLVESPNPSSRLLTAVLVVQAALVLTHVLGLIYGALILSAQVLSDVWRRRLRLKVYLCYAVGWLALLVWIPAIRASIAVGRPRGWITMPTLHGMVDSYTFSSGAEWLYLMKERNEELAFQLTRHLIECLFLIACAVALAGFLRSSLTKREDQEPKPENDLLLAAFALLLMPVVLFVLSHLVTPVFVPRYFLPSGIGMAIVFAAFASRLGADRRFPSRVSHVAWPFILLLLLLSPVASGFVARTPFAVVTRLDVGRLKTEIPQGTVLVTGWQEDFSRLMRYGGNLRSRSYFLLDWPTTLAESRGFITDYHLMVAYRRAGYYADNIQDQNSFLCSHPDFFVLDTKAQEGASPTWFNLVVRKNPHFEWKQIDRLQGSDMTRLLFSVHRTGLLPFCQQ